MADLQRRSLCFGLRLAIAFGHHYIFHFFQLDAFSFRNRATDKPVAEQAADGKYPHWEGTMEVREQIGVVVDHREGLRNDKVGQLHAADCDAHALRTHAVREDL